MSRWLLNDTSQAMLCQWKLKTGTCRGGAIGACAPAPSAILTRLYFFFSRDLPWPLAIDKITRLLWVSYVRWWLFTWGHPWRAYTPYRDVWRYAAAPWMSDRCLAGELQERFYFTVKKGDFNSGLSVCSSIMCAWFGVLHSTSNRPPPSWNPPN